MTKNGFFFKSFFISSGTNGKNVLPGVNCCSFGLWEEMVDIHENMAKYYCAV